MLDFILKYWIECLFGVIVTGMTFIFKMLLNNAKESKAIKDGMKGILHNDIIYRCKKYLIIGYVTLEDMEELEYLFKPYKLLGGNGTAEKLMNRVYNLPIKNEEE
jgi:hypothetical protein